MNSWEMVSRCLEANQGKGNSGMLVPVPQLDMDALIGEHTPHDEICTDYPDSLGPNLILWNGRAHLIVLTLINDDERR